MWLILAWIVLSFPFGVLVGKWIKAGSGVAYRPELGGPEGPEPHPRLRLAGAISNAGGK